MDNIDLSSFIAQLEQPTFFTNNPVICCTGASYTPFFFSLLLQHLRNNEISLENVDHTVLENASFKAKCETSFLGLSMIYWLGDSALFERKQAELLAYLKQYQGPNTLIFFTTALVAEAPWFTVTIPTEIGQQEFLQLGELWYPGSIKQTSRFVIHLFKKYHKVPLDKACLLMHYATVVGGATDLFMQEWVDGLIVPDKSLFTLSAHFFAKNGGAFFELWQRIAHDYPPVFWTSFWSEQLFRAIGFVQYMRAKNMIEAKKISYRLPFSFIQKDWKLISVNELQRMHNTLYEVEYELKNGLCEHRIEYWYSSFLMRKN